MKVERGDRGGGGEREGEIGVGERGGGEGGGGGGGAEIGGGRRKGE